MQSLPHRLSFLKRLVGYLLLLYLALCPQIGLADEFSAIVRHAKLIETADGFSIHAEIEYRLSPTSKEALHKGVPLSWDVLIKLNQRGFLFDTTVYQQKLSFYLQFHALLNQYEVKSPAAQVEMFLTLNAALNFMALVHDTVHSSKGLLKTGNSYELAVKSEFNREFLPIPLRPVAYLDSQWFLSSDWFVWPIQK